ncbi:MAG TPA: hypothetical protein VFK59_03770, partial [Actinomycetota bacterium]|nr:hypothetical protein [Actinomycetota bacterium]
MLRGSRIVAPGASALVAFSMLVPGGVASGMRPAAPTPFVTDARSFLVPLVDGVVVQPILTTGDIVGEGDVSYQMSGAPDGIGWYASAEGQIEVFFNHELHPVWDPSGARVSHLTLNPAGDVMAAEYVVDGTE